MKKTLSVFLMACSGFRVCAWSGSGTADDPWQLTETMTAVYDLETHLLKIEGSGPMYVWAGDLDPAPWWGVKDDITAVEISQGVESISGQSFLGCRKLTAITIPPSVKIIDAQAFLDCVSLQTVVIPNGVENIEAGAFWGCAALTSVVVPSSVTNLGFRVFWKCTNIGSVQLGEGLQVIGEEAFSYCRLLPRISIPSSVSAIGVGAFRDCSELMDIYFCGDFVPVIGSGAFSGCAGDLILHAGAGWKGRSRIVAGVCLAVDGEQGGVREVAVTVTNVVVNYVFNSVQPEFANPPTADTGFVNIITEVKGSCVAIPSTWADNYPSFVEKFGSDFAKALSMKTGKKDGAGNDMFVWQDYVAGTDPTEPEDKFTASITVVEGKVTVSYTPELDDVCKALRKYTTWGKKSLLDMNWTEVQEGHVAEYNFFKVTVEMR